MWQVFEQPGGGKWVGATAISAAVAEPAAAGEEPLTEQPGAVAAPSGEAHAQQALVRFRCIAVHQSVAL